MNPAARAAAPDLASPAEPLHAAGQPVPATGQLGFDIVSRIAECVPALRDAERKVASRILDDLAVAAHASIGEIAAQAEVSVATVTRFAKAVGCRDVRELKLRLAQAAAVGERFLAPAAGLPGDAASASRVYEDVRATLEQHHALLRQTAFEAPAAALAGARMIYVYGQGGGSTALADELRFRLVRFGRPVASYQDALLQRMVASTMSEDCVLVALSVTGRVREQSGGRRRSQVSRWQ